MDNNTEGNFKNIYRPKLSWAADVKLQARLRWIIFKQEMTADLAGSLVFKKGLSLALIFICVFIGTSAYAYSSEDVIPGNYLYNYKRELENIELKLASGTSTKAATYNRLAERRVSEAKKLSTNIRKKKEAAKAPENLSKDRHKYEGYIYKNLEEASAYQAVAETLAETEENGWQNKQEDIIEIASNVGLESNEKLIDKILVIIEDAKGDSDKEEQAGRQQAEKQKGNASFLPANEKKPVATTTDNGSSKDKSEKDRPETSKPKAKSKESKENESKRLENIRRNIGNFEKSLANASTTPENKKLLIRQIESRALKAEENIKKAESPEAQKYLKSAENLLNYGNYFIREQKKEDKQDNEKTENKERSKSSFRKDSDDSRKADEEKNDNQDRDENRRD